MAMPIANVSHDGKKFRVSYRYKDPETGKYRNTCKRGFKREKDAKNWIADELPAIVARLEQKKKTIETMTMDELIEEYCNYMGITIRKTSLGTKGNIIQSKVLPYFTGTLVVDVNATDIINWQLELSKPIKKVQKTIINSSGKAEKVTTYERYSKTYLRTINNQIVAIFNYATTIRKLPTSPCRGVRKMGSKKAPEREIWEPEEFEKFIKTQEHKPLLYYAYLKEAYHKVDDEVDKGLKNTESFRSVKIPSFLVEELKDFTESLGPLDPNSRIFETSKSTLLKHLHEGAAKAGVKDICVHCLRHSYISMCVYNGVPYTTISAQVGHSEFLQSLHYSHSYKNSGDFLVNALEQVKGGAANV